MTSEECKNGKRRLFAQIDIQFVSKILTNDL